MHFRAILATALPLLSLTAQALPIARRDFVQLGDGGQGSAVGASSNPADASSPQADYGSGAPPKSSYAGAGSAGQSSGKGGMQQGGQQGSQQGSSGGVGAQGASGTQGSNSTQGASGTQGQGATGTSSAAKAARTRACDQGDQSLASGMQALVTIGLGQQAAALTLKQTVSAKQINKSDFKTNQQRLQQFITTAKLQLQMAQAIADDGSFAQPQLASLQKSLGQQEATVKSLKGDASDIKTLAALQSSFKTATGVTQDGLSNAVVDCFLPLDTVSG